MLTSTANLILIGPMGAGKTTIGRRLAKSLTREFVDSDKEIERRTGVSIPLIFEMEGEEGFRARESAMIAELTQKKSLVLATGGGVVLDADNRRHLAQSGLVIYLFTSVSEQLRRVQHDTNRPLLRTDNPRGKLQQLLNMRDPLYREIADIVIDTDGAHVNQSTKRILQHVRSAQS